MFEIAMLQLELSYYSCSTLTVLIRRSLILPTTALMIHYMKQHEANSGRVNVVEVGDGKDTFNVFKSERLRQESFTAHQTLH